MRTIEHYTEEKPQGFSINIKAWDSELKEPVNHVFWLCGCSMLEVLSAIKNTPVRGNELFDDAKKKSVEALEFIPATDY